MLLVGCGLLVAVGAELVLGPFAEVADTASAPGASPAGATNRVAVLVTLREQMDAARYRGRPRALIAAMHRQSRRSAG